MRAFFKMLCVVGMLFPAAAYASNCGTFPYLLSNGTTADANQVMADFNLLLNCSNNNLAKNGANSDITSLTGLTTPLAPAQGGSVLFVGGTTTGTANAQALASTTPTGFVLTNGYHVSFIAGFQNTGAMTLSVNGTTAKTVASEGTALAGNELQAGVEYNATYDGTFWEITNISPKVYFDAYVPSTITNATGGSVIYNMNNVTYMVLHEIGAGFDPSTGIFHVPVTGVYEFTYWVTYTTTSGTGYTFAQIGLNVGGTIFSSPIAIPYISAGGQIFGTTNAVLTKGTSVYPLFVMNSGSAVGISIMGTTETRFQGALISTTGAF